MDFVVSKVAMSVCALLVVAILAGLADPDNYVDADSELEACLEDFCSLAELGVLSGCEMKTLWRAPVLSTGDEVVMNIWDGTVSASTRDGRVLKQPQFGIHTWAWDGSSLNASTVETLDSADPGFKARSGDSISIETRTVLFEDSPTLMVFASVS